MNSTPPPPPSAPPPPPPPSDGHLVEAAGEQDAGAWEELVRRHGPTMSAVAAASGRAKQTQQAFDALHAALISPDRGEDDQSARAVRPRLISQLTGEDFGPGGSVDPSVEAVELAGSERSAVELDDLASIGRAFSTLPESWQTALWHRVVEQQQAAQYATLLGRAANDVGATVHRAEVGLFDAYLHDQRAQRDVLPDCVAVISLLGGAHRQELSAEDQQIVDDHLENPRASDDSTDAAIDTAIDTGIDGSTDAASDPAAARCDPCARRLAVGRELSRLLPAAVVPGLTELSVERYRSVASESAAAAAGGGADRRRRAIAAVAVVAVLLAAGVAVVAIRNSLGVSETDAGTDPATSASSSPATEPAATEPVDTDAPTESASTTAAPAPTTTELLLRPAITGPVNTVQVTFGEPKISGFAPAQVELSAVLSSPGPVFAGGTGTIDVMVTNDGAVDASATATLEVPSGVVFDALVDGPARCADPSDDSARCDIDVAAGSTERVTIRFRLQSRIVGGFVVTSNIAEEALEVPISAVPHLLHSSVDEGQLIVAGNTLMTCADTDPACGDARSGIGDLVNRWDLPAQFVGADRGPDWINSSSATIDLGRGGVEAAYLFWSGDLSERDVVIPNDGRAERVTFLPPGASQSVEIEAETVRLGDFDASQYFGAVDVTDLVKFFGPGEYTVGNVESAEVQGSYAGWAMVIITSDDSLPRRSNMVISPFSWFSPDHTYAIEIDVLPQRAATADLGVIAFEGERSFVPERLEVGGDVLGETEFDSSIVGKRNPSYDNNLGIDIDVYDLVIDTSDGILPIRATSDDDGIRLAVLALAVDVE